MKIVVWNCSRGDPAERFEELASLDADIAVLTEARSPRVESDHLVWWGPPGSLGTAVVAAGDYRVTRAPLVPDASPSAVPLLIRGPVDFNLLAVWAFKETSYANALSRVIDAYEPFIKSNPTVVAGDFNSNAIWDGGNRRVNYSVNAQRLESTFGLKSAYHTYTGEKPGSEEKATLYYQWKEARPFHIDYCFVPNEWDILHADIPDFEQFTTSDHRPLAVAVKVPASLRGSARIDFSPFLREQAL